MNKNQLAAKIWASANKMRAKIEANEYKDFILGFIFYKFLSDKELTFLKSNGVEGDDLHTIKEDDRETVTYLQNNLGYFIAYEYLFSTWLAQGRNFSIASVRDALSAFERLIQPERKKLFGGIFKSLHSGLSKLGASDAEQSKAVRDILMLIKEIPTDARQDYDVLGFVYEYLISNFAANAGKKAGEFYTPHEVSVLMSDIIAHHLKGQQNICIYDPTSGSGSLLINIGKSVARHTEGNNNIKYYAQELKTATFNLTRMNLIMRGINPSNIEVRCGDTLKEDWPYFDETDPQKTYDPLYLDAVVSNPPYSQEWDPRDQENDPRYAAFGLAPKGKADFAFLLHDLYHVKPEGIMTIVLPHGVLYRGDSEYQIRKALIENNHIDAIIGLPEKIFFGTGISTIIMVLKRAKTRRDDNVLFVDASLGFAKEGKNNILRASDIRKITDAVTCRAEIPKFSRLVSREEIRHNYYNLNISRYVDASPCPERYDIYATMFGGIPATDLDSLADYWQAFPSLRGELFQLNAEGYSHLKSEELRSQIECNSDVQAFGEAYRAAFVDLGDFLEQALVRPMLTLGIVQTEEAITAELFRRLSPFSLIDPYQAYQFFSEVWGGVASDIEVLQSEGFGAVRIVDPIMVVKKKDGKEVEVQEGWVSRLLPFDLVQRELLAEQVEHIEGLEERLADITTELETLIEGLSPEDQDKSFLNDDNTKFVSKELNAEVKRIKSNISTPETVALQGFPTTKADKDAFITAHPEIPWDEVEPGKSGYTKTQINKLIALLIDAYEHPEGSYEAILLSAQRLLSEETDKKNALKRSLQKIEQNTIALIIEGITDEVATDLLRKKWLPPLLSTLDRMPSEVTNALSQQIARLHKKYATSYADITARINKAEQTLYKLLGNLEGETADRLGLEAFRNTLGNKTVQR